MKKWIGHAFALFFLCGFLSAVHATSFVGLIGADYQPNHYASGNTLNAHDVFYAGGGTSPFTNIYTELSQLKAAGVTVVRSYATTQYTWIEIINDANALGLSVIYEAVIPQVDGSCTQAEYPDNCPAISSANTLLSNIIKAVGATKFNNTVILVLAGHENVDTPDQFGNPSNAKYLIAAVHNLQKITTVPVGGAFVSGNLVTPPSLSSGYTISDILNSYSAGAPAAFDPYPFQWGVPVAEAVTDASAVNSIQWDYNEINMNKIAGNRSIFMAESGWATAGTTNPGYACGTGSFPPCAPSIPNAATYLSALYTFVGTTSNNAGVLAFEAYDEPAKAASTSMEDYYGMFDSDCNLKGPNNTMLVPAGSGYMPANYHACQGFSSGALLVVDGQFAQTPITMQITQTNPETSLSASMTVTGISANTVTGNDGGTWPYFLVFAGATFVITDNAGSMCTGTISSIDASQNITFSGVSGCGCSNNACFPA
jgi:hypothetical protein